VSAPYEQDCPSCVGAIRGARRRLDNAVAQVDRYRIAVLQVRKDARLESRRARNADPVHQHVGEDAPGDECTLAFHAQEAERCKVEMRKLAALVNEWQSYATDEARRIATAVDALLAGCDLCGRALLAKGAAE